MAKGKRNVGFTIVIIIIIIGALIGIGALILNNIFSSSSSTYQTDGEELGYDVFIGDENLEVTTAEDEGRDLVEELKAVNETYKDAVAWIKVPGTTIDFPVFQGTDNTTYYRDDRDGVTQDWGETFLDYRCDVDELSELMTNIIIYGHNTETDNRFTPLLNYKRQEFFETHKYIELATLNGTYTYEIFTVYKTDTSFFYIDTEFSSLTEYENFLKSIVKKTRYDTEVEVSSSDAILTLSTCDYSLSNGRFVVQAKLVK